MVREACQAVALQIRELRQFDPVALKPQGWQDPASPVHWGDHRLCKPHGPTVPRTDQDRWVLMFDVPVGSLVSVVVLLHTCAAALQRVGPTHAARGNAELQLDVAVCANERPAQDRLGEETRHGRQEVPQQGVPKRKRPGRSEASSQVPVESLEIGWEVVQQSAVRGAIQPPADLAAVGYRVLRVDEARPAVERLTRQ